MTKFYIDSSGAYIGGFDGADPPNGSIEVPIAPACASLKWLGSEWIVPHTAPSSSQIESAIQANLDSYAKSWGYNDIASACTYVGDPCAKFNAEALVLRQWRSDTWLTVEATDAQIAAGTQPYPQTIEAALSLLPAAPARPA